MADWKLPPTSTSRSGLRSMRAENVFYELGMMYASGRSVPADLVSAHKWFNLAAMKGNAEAAACGARSPPR